MYVALDSANVLYVRSLVGLHNRPDLKIVVPGWLVNNYRGLSRPVVIDHAVHIGLIPSPQRVPWRRAIEHLDGQGLLLPFSGTEKR